MENVNSVNTFKYIYYKVNFYLHIEIIDPYGENKKSWQACECTLLLYDTIISLGKI